MGSIIDYIKPIRNLIFRIILLPKKLWLNPNIGNMTSIDSRYIEIINPSCIRVGNRTKIMAGLRLVAVKKYGKECYSPSISIGDSVCINQNFHCTCASHIQIGDGTSITANCGIFDIIHPYTDVYTNPRLQPIITKPIIIGKNCLIGMNSVIMPGVNLGDHVVVGANSTVYAGSYPSYSVLVGSPAKIIKKFDFENKEWKRTDNKGMFI